MGRLKQHLSLLTNLQANWAVLLVLDGLAHAHAGPNPSLLLHSINQNKSRGLPGFKGWEELRSPTAKDMDGGRGRVLATFTTNLSL